MALLYVAADIYSHKVNLQLEFPQLPSLSTLFQCIDHHFINECAVLRPSGVPAQVFGVEKLQIYQDDASGKTAAGRSLGDAAKRHSGSVKPTTGSWQDLVSSSQLYHRAQLYVFQTDPNVVESQQKISRHLSRKPSPLANVTEQLPTTPAARNDTAVTVTTTATAQTQSSLAVGNVARSNSGNKTTAEQPQPRDASVVTLGPITSHSAFRVAATEAHTSSLVTTHRSVLAETYRDRPPLASVAELSPIRFRALPHGYHERIDVSSAPRSPVPLSSLPQFPLDAHLTPSSASGHRHAATAQPPFPSPQSPWQPSPSTHSSGLASKQLSAVRKHPGESANQQERLQHLFHVLSHPSAARMEGEPFPQVTMDQLRRQLEQLHIHIASTIALSEIFQRSDHDRNGALSFDEMCDFFRYLPTLMDTLYFRLLDEEDAARLQEVLRSEAAALDAARMEQHDVLHRRDELDRELAAHETQLQLLTEQEREIARERGASSDQWKTVEADELRVQRDLSELQSDLQRQNRHVEQVRYAAEEVSRRAEACAAKVRQGSTILQSLDARISELRRQLEATEREAEAQRRTISDALQEEQQLSKDLQCLKQQEGEVLQGLELRSDRGRELERQQQHFREVRSETQERCSRLDRELRDLAQERALKEQRCTELVACREEAERRLKAAAAAVQRQDERMQSVETKISQFDVQRVSMEQRERPLLDEELRLRAQRDALDRQEHRFRREADTLFRPGESRTGSSSV